MHRTDGDNNLAGAFTDGPPGTAVEEDWLNAVQEEIIGVITAAGITLSKSDQTQLLTALSTLGLENNATHNYGAAAADWTLTATEALATHITVTNASGAVDALIPATSVRPGHIYTILNTSGQVLTFKVIGQTGGSIANGKLGLYLTGATDVFEVYEQA